MRHESSLGSPNELAALYASGSMTLAEREWFEQHIDSGCSECRSELSRLRNVVDGLTLAALPMAPQPQTRRTLLERVAAERGASKAESPLSPHLEHSAPAAATTPFTLRATEGEWQETSVPGVSIRTLYIDRQGDQYRAMVRMAAGASYPRHIHSGPEHCFVLEGDLHVEGDVLRAGDYQVAPPGSHHGRQWTEGGCLLLISSSLHDNFA